MKPKQPLSPLGRRFLLAVALGLLLDDERARERGMRCAVLHPDERVPLRQLQRLTTRARRPERKDK